MSAPTPEFVLGYRAMMLDGVGREARNYQESFGGHSRR